MLPSMLCRTIGTEEPAPFHGSALFSAMVVWWFLGSRGDIRHEKR